MPIINYSRNLEFGLVKFSKKLSETPTGLIRWLSIIPCLVWEFTESNFSTFVIPNTAFGVLSAFAPSAFGKEQQRSLLTILSRAPLVVVFNWANVLVFDLANQRSPESIREDQINKPWRPIPTGKVTADQARRMLLTSVPLVLGLNFCLGVWAQGALIHILTWLYNDLRGGDELARDGIIAIAYGLFNGASLKIIAGSLNDGEFMWIGMISGVIMTTMQIQDLKDQAGDYTRGRRTIPLFLGDGVSRLMITFCICFWTYTCTAFWHTSFLGTLFVGILGLIIVSRLWVKQRPDEDATTWKCWCVWMVTLYILPIIGVAKI